MGEFLTTGHVKEILDNAPSDIPKQDIINGLVNKGYEIEGLNAEFSPLEAVKNVPTSLLEYGKNIWTALTKPAQTFKGIRNVAQGGMSEYMSKFGDRPEDAYGKDKEQYFDAMVNFFSERYGGKDKLLNTIEKDPVGFMADLSTVISGAGAVGGSTKVIEAGRVLEPTSAFIDVAKGLGGLSKKGVMKFNEATGINNLLKGEATVFTQRAIGISPKSIVNIARKTFNKEPAEVIAQLGIHGTPEQMANDLESIAKMSKNSVDTKLASINKVYKSQTIKNVLDDLKDTVAGVKVKDPESKKVITFIDNMIDKHNKTGLTLSEANEVRRLMDRIDSPYAKTAHISGIGTVDFGKTGFAAEDLENIRKSLSKFIKTKATEAGYPEIDKLNRTTNFATETSSYLRENALALKGRKPFVEEFLGSFFAGGGLVGYGTTGDPRWLFGAMGLVGLRRKIRNPKFLTALSNKLMTLSDKDYKSFSDMVRAGKPSKPGIVIAKRIGKDLQKIFPELRMGGITEKQTQE